MKFRKGDIVRNVFQSKGYPDSYMMYLGKKTKQARTVGGLLIKERYYECLSIDGTKTLLYQKNFDGIDSLEYIGHMEEYDAFVRALRAMPEPYCEPARNGECEIEIQQPNGWLETV